MHFLNYFLKFLLFQEGVLGTVLFWSIQSVYLCFVICVAQYGITTRWLQNRGCVLFQQPMDAEQCFAKLPSTDIALQIAIYYYSQQLASRLRWYGDEDDSSCLSRIYRTSPGSLTSAIVTYISWVLSDPAASTQMSDSVQQMALRLMHYNSRLIELTQAQALRRLDRGQCYIILKLY